jgi:hypothetical protein
MQHKLEGGLALRIGVNTGEVVVGRPREGSSFVSGDAVNVAARLEQGAEPGEILAGERTVAAARGAFEFGEQRAVEAKGKPGGVSCRRVMRALTLMRPRGVGGLARAFVGRNAELDRLQTAFRRAAERSRPVLVTIVGDAGVGKTRLVRELWEQLADEEPEPLRRTGRCLAYGQGITYWPLAEVLKEHLGILDSDPPEQVRRRLGDREILGLTLGLDLAGDLHPLAARDRLHAAWVSLLSELAAERPAVVLVEDVHWAEDPLLDLIERLARDVRGPLLLLATARPDFVDRRSAWNGRMDTETLWLEPLSAETAASLVNSLLAGDLPSRVRELVVERAEGNPFFVEEVLGSLIDAGVLERVTGSWRAGDLPPGFEIPDSVQAVLAARIDLLGEAEKAALQAAAVIGRAFWTGPVYELVEGLEPDLHALESRDFIRQRASSSLEGEVEYVFKHALTREVAYGGLTKARRARLHARFAEWIERVGEGRDEHAPLLAHHYAEAVHPEDVDVVWGDAEEELERLRTKSVHWLRRAAEIAISRYEIEDGINLLEQAVALEPDAAEQARLYRRIGRAHALKFDGDAFIEAMRTAISLADDPSERAETYADLAFQTVARSGMWKQRPGLEVMDEWTSRALADAQPGTPARVKALLARSVWRLEGAEAAAEASALAERLGDVELRSYAWDARGILAFREADFQAAHQWETRRFDLLDELTDPDHIQDLYLSSIPTCAAVGRLREARRLADANHALCSRLTPHHRLHGIACRLEVEELTGDWGRIRDLEQEALEAVDENRATFCIRNPRSLLLCAVAEQLMGSHGLSRELEERAVELRAKGYGATLTGPHARLALCRGDLGQLEGLFGDADWFQHQTWFGLPAAAVRLDAAVALGDRGRVEADAELLLKPRTYLEPFVLRALGIVQEDDALLAEADEKFRALRLDWHADQTNRLIELRAQAT